MASIESLLNPLPATEFFRQRYTTASSSPRPKNFPLERMKRPRIPKDAPIFTPGKTRGELRYPPHEDDQDEELVKEHKRFEIHPMGHVAEYPRHIPYSSEKKTFLERTGRESFEVFQYTFKIPNEDKTWTVMWDYNIGLVRTTHLFKCNDYSKTTPAKMLNANPGLRDICHSITGGALAAQGYWMPFEAAKAVSATFCWNIRHALTPLFGKEFPSLCIPPDSPQFGKMVIDPDIVRRSTELANDYRLQELDS
ncbi:transcription regulator HTH, apses-type DNA-binding domain-containing protein, partial [Talaromyces proteolyticus]